jgi:glucans biosynthesis protein
MTPEFRKLWGKLGQSRDFSTLFPAHASTRDKDNRPKKTLGQGTNQLCFRRETDLNQLKTCYKRLMPSKSKERGRPDLLWLLFLFLGQTVFGESFGLEELRAKAQLLAARPFSPSTNHVSDALLNLSYVEYRNIQFDQSKALWGKEKLPFQIEFFHPGYVHRQTVVINEVNPSGVHQIPFSSQLFSYGANNLVLPADLSFAGFRISHPLQEFGEVASFLGASYFRMIGRGQVYGSSARGLAVNSTSLSAEEFPAFRQFWIHKPSPRDRDLIVLALLDSPSVTGAFKFSIRPGTATIATVNSSIFFRKGIKELGIAPLTSMFLHDENSHAPFGDFRPEVHDADGLLVHTGRGEWIWRPLETGQMMRVNAYQDENPKGFGLLQRDRNFEHYQDLIGKYHLRPSVWITPLTNWGQGSVELMQLPSKTEFSDNVVAFWVPANPPRAGDSLDLNYEIHWLTNNLSELGRVRATRVGRVIEEPPKVPANLRFVLDFEGASMEALSAQEQLQAEVHCGEGGKFVADTVLKNELNGTWRLVIEITEPTKAVDLRAFLKHRGQPVTETWNYTWQP